MISLNNVVSDIELCLVLADQVLAAVPLDDLLHLGCQPRRTPQPGTLGGLDYLLHFEPIG